MGAESDMLEVALMAREDSDFGGTLTYGADDYPCSIGTTGFGARLVAGGFSPNAEITITLRKSVFDPDGLDAGQPLTVKDANGLARSLKIATEGVKDCVYAWELTCNDLNQNA